MAEGTRTQVQYRYNTSTVSYSVLDHRGPALVRLRVELVPYSRNLLQQLRQFIYQHNNQSCLQLAKSSLLLLVSLPSARLAIFEQLSDIFLKSVVANKEESNNELYSATQAIHATLMELLHRSPDAWTGIIDEWALNLLGLISQQCVDKIGIPASSSVDERLQYMMDNQATQFLIDIAKQCFNIKLNRNEGDCVNCLLETSVKYSNQFDWVLTHFASCFSSVLLPHLLLGGLKDFYQNSYKKDGIYVNEDSITSGVIRVLNYIAVQHPSEIRTSLLSFFSTSLGTSDKLDEMYLAAVPFFLYILSVSPVLLEISTIEFVRLWNHDLLMRLYEQSQRRNGYNLTTLVISVMQNVKTGAKELLQCFVSIARENDGSDNVANSEQNAIYNSCVRIMNSFLRHLQQLVQQKSGSSDENISSSTSAELLVPFLVELQKHKDVLCREMLKESGICQFWLIRILVLIGVYEGMDSAAELLSYIVLHAHTVEMACRLLGNILQLLTWESHPETKSFIRSRLVQSLQSRILKFANLLQHPNDEMSTIVLKLMIYLKPAEANMDVKTVSLMSQSLVTFFFQLLCTYEEHRTDHQNLLKSIKAVMIALCKQPMGPVFVLRRLVEDALLSPVNSEMLGNDNSELPDILRITGRRTKYTISSTMSEPHVSLLKANWSNQYDLIKTSGSKSLFHDGLIGRVHSNNNGLYNSNGVTNGSNIQEQVLLKTSLYVNILRECAKSNNEWDKRTKSGYVSPSGEPNSWTNVSRLEVLSITVVDLLSPDLIPVPKACYDDDFVKHPDTIERDIHVFKVFDKCPLLFDILKFIAEDPSAICNCDTILRSLLSVLLNYWLRNKESKVAESPAQLEMSCKLIKLLSVAGWIPNPVTSIHHLFSKCTPYQVYLLLMTAWKYLKDNKPRKPDQFITNRHSLPECKEEDNRLIRSLVQEKISDIGSHYAEFINGSI
ncbi:uncharacterized protein TRIADDRAFT_51610 [Trichoplax adhaerens]|uniref:Integrator complex subunit 5 C-terminal domain-containing protein n=1 Tax=Trichoplax adhaerens TaxID=10228 RepID=B3RK36_TRIAD|nr:hypothetical protein TRIADDRAFT_51610 [Trichoplax adhaerens]EDV29370.1 hypothetical protein TRIADDRAFT_51610 [Trichoplax adhaerens]|eukprot:XP_002108572.1 hypothetical protein TRIADDRAFT_51610 [Trichoplax adhaerens]